MTRLRTVCLSFIAAALCLAGGAGAQVHRSIPGLGDAYRPDYVRRDAQVFADALQLDPDQQTIVETLFDDYENEFQSGIAGVREKLANYRPSPAQLAAVRAEFQDRLRNELATLMAERETVLQSGGDTAGQLDDIAKKVEALQAELAQFAQNEVGRNDMVEAHMVELERALAQWKVEKQAIRENFESSLKAVLNESQLERWPIAERQLRRQKTLSDGVLAGESVDLFSIVKRVPLDSAETNAVLRSFGSYEVDLDAALQARNKWLDEHKAELHNALGSRDAAAVATLAQQEFQLRQSVRDATLTAASQLGAVVDAEAAAELTRLFRDAAFPQVYRSTTAERTFQSVLQSNNLDADQRQAVQELHAAYLGELAPLNERITRTIVQEQPGQQVERLQQQASGGRREPSQDPIRELFLTRAAMDDRYIAQLSGMLTDEQKATIPALASPRTAVPEPVPSDDPADAAPIAANNDFLAEFDADGDGMLDADEQSALREHIAKLRGTVKSRSDESPEH